MKIQPNSNIPDSTYFTSTDVAPVIEGNTLTVFDGKGSRRGWGVPQVSSTVIINTDTFTAVHVGFSHKHRGGQAWYYFMGQQRKTWGQLPDTLRQQVLDNLKAAPSWAKIPGKLAGERKSPALAIRTAYKVVKRLEDGRMVSLYDGQTEYTMGKRLVQKARDNHKGGFYAYPDLPDMMAEWEEGTLIPARCYAGVSQIAVLEVELAGTILVYEENKLAATYLTPVRVVEVLDTKTRKK